MVVLQEHNISDLLPTGLIATRKLDKIMDKKEWYSIDRNFFYAQLENKKKKKKIPIQTRGRYKKMGIVSVLKIDQL